MNAYHIFGFVLYSHYFIGSVFAGASGLSLLPIIALMGAVVYRAGGITLHRVTLMYAAIILVIYSFYFIFSNWTDYAIYKYGMLSLKALPLLLIGSLIVQHRDKYFRGISHALLLFLGICILYLAFVNITTGVNNRMEIGVFNPIWISRGLFELVLILVIVLHTRWRYTLAVFIAAVGVAYFAGSKGPILAFLLTYFFWLRSKGLVGDNGVRKFLFYALLFAGPMIIYAVADPTSYLFQRFFLPVPDGTSTEIIEESRAIVWPATMSMFLAQDAIPLLFGNGIGSFPSFYFGNGADFRYYPHNLMLELLVEHGAVLAVGMVILIIAKIKKTRSDFKYLLIYFLINAMFSGDLILNEYIFFYLGLVIADRAPPLCGKILQQEMLKV